MELTKIYTDREGHSHFTVEPIIMDEKTDMGFYSSVQSDVKHFYFQNTLPHHEWDFNAVSARIYVVIMSGTLEVEVSNGEKRTFSPNDIVFLDDHHGQGHKIKTFESTVSALMIHMK